MNIASRRMDISEDVTSRPFKFTAPKGMSSTSGEGEPNVAAGYNFVNRRRARRKTITLNEETKTTFPSGIHSLSESAFSPVPEPSRSKLPPLQTTFLPPTSLLDHEEAKLVGDEGIRGVISPRKISNRLVASSPTKKAPPIGLTRQASSQVLASPSRNSALGGDKKSDPNLYGRGVPRTLTLPAHFTDSLMKMKITNVTGEQDNESVESFLLDTPGVMGGGLENMTHSMAILRSIGGDDDGMDAEMEVEPGSYSQKTLRGSPENDDLAPSSPIKNKRRLPKSLDLPSIQPRTEEDANDADDEGGAGDEDARFLSPVLISGSRGRQDRMQGVRETSPNILRRSARRPKRMERLLDRIGGLAEDETDLMIPAPESVVFRKRARTRDGDGEQDSGIEDGRASKRLKRK